MAGVTIQQASGVIEYYEPEHTSKMGMDDASIREHEEVTKVKASLFRYITPRTSNLFRLVGISSTVGILVHFLKKCIQLSY